MEHRIASIKRVDPNGRPSKYDLSYASESYDVFYTVQARFLNSDGKSASPAQTYKFQVKGLSVSELDEVYTQIEKDLKYIADNATKAIEASITYVNFKVTELYVKMA